MSEYTLWHVFFFVFLIESKTSLKIYSFFFKSICATEVLRSLLAQLNAGGKCFASVPML